MAGEVAARRAQYLPLIQQAAARHGIPWQLADVIAQRESGYDPTARGGSGEWGLMQIMPATAATVGLDRSRAFDPAANIEAGVRYLAQKYRQAGGDYRLAAVGYNGGSPNSRHPGALAYGNAIAAALGGGGGPVGSGAAAAAGGGIDPISALSFTTPKAAPDMQAPALPGYLQGAAAPPPAPADPGLMSLAELMRHADYQSPYQPIASAPLRRLGGGLG